jgi:hypothetical protein
MNLPIAKPKPEGETDWVNNDNRRFYKKLANDPALVGKVELAIARYPRDNTALAENLIEMGLDKNDGTALDSSSISWIKKVVEMLANDR